MAARNADIGEHLGQMRIEFLVSRNAVTIVESRSPWDGSAGDWWQQEVARLRFERTRGWTLYWSDRNSDFHVYDRVPSTVRVKRLLDEVDEDPTCIFWG